jgi:pyroglutamyl-peptidase
MSTLISGFQPFDGAIINPSEIVSAHFGGISLPVVRQKAFDALLEAFHRLNPDAILMLGQAGGTDHIRLERIAVNLDDYSIPDNEGNQPKEEKVILDAPDAYFSTLPLRRIFDQLTFCKIPVQFSLSAGTYICNHLFFQVMHFLHRQKINIPAGFIHLPPTMEPTTMIQTIDWVIHSL